jgi:PIN domain nuclease of toxin-antitoxin system
VISSVNWSEVLQKLGSLGSQVDKIETSLFALGLDVVDFTAYDARLAASL